MGSWIRAPQTGGLHRRQLLSQFWRPDFEIRVSAGWVSHKASSGLVDVCLHVHMVFPLVCLCPHLLPRGHRPCCLGAHLMSPCESHSECWGVRTAACEPRGHDSAHQAPFLPSSHRTSTLFPTSCLQLSSSHFLSLTCQASCTARRTMKAEKSKCPVSPFSPSLNLLCDLNCLGCVACGMA